MKGLSLVWDMPVPYSDNHPVALDTESESIPGAGKVWLYLEPDGDVLPAQGIKTVIGNLLEQTLAGNMEKSSGLTPADWHARYRLQAGWTAGIRDYLYQRASLADARRVLEVGCGSGAILATLHEHSQAQVMGLDIDRPHPEGSPPSHRYQQSNFVNGDALQLPFADRGLRCRPLPLLPVMGRTPVHLPCRKWRGFAGRVAPSWHWPNRITPVASITPDELEVLGQIADREPEAAGG